MIDSIFFKIAGVFFILLAGFVAGRLAGTIALRMYVKRHRRMIREAESVKNARALIMLISILISLVLLRVEITPYIIFAFYESLPTIVSFILVVAAVIIIVNILMYIIGLFFSKTGMIEFMQEYMNESLVKVIFIVLRIILYIVFLFLGISALGFDIALLYSTMWMFVYPVFILLLAIILWGSRKLIENYITGFYIKHKGIVKEGESISMNGSNYEIVEMNDQGMIAKKGSRDFVFIPYSIILSSPLYMKNFKLFIRTLEDIKKYFVPQHPSYCGPASASMALHFFGYNISQDEIGKLAGTVRGKGTHPQRLIDAVEKLTNNEVKGAWINADKIGNLRDEIATWLMDGAIVIIDYKKKYLFPEAKTGHYSLCLAVEEDELLIVDPNSRLGGVYFANYSDVQKGMDTYSETNQGKRGYIVLAPKDTKAYRRIVEGVIYSDTGFYDRLTKTLAGKISSMITKSRKNITSVMPEPVKDMLEKREKRNKISRLWQPEKQE